MFKAHIFYDSVVDVYNDGEQPDQPGTSWDMVLEAETKEALKAQIADYTFCDWSKGEIDQDDANDYAHATEYWAGYMADDQNEGSATDAQMALWKQGKLKLWAVHCHILVSEITERKAVL